MFFESSCVDKASDNPITHFRIVGWNTNECRFDHYTFEFDYVGKIIELGFDFLDSLWLIGDYRKSTTIVSRTNKTHDFHSSLFLFALNKICIITFNLIKVVASNWYEIQTKLQRLCESVCQAWVL